MGLISDFKKFAMRGNLIDMAIGFTVGAAFTTIAKSLVNDIIMPPIGMAMGRSDFADLFFLMKPGEQSPGPYATLADAQAAGAVTINYGQFGNAVFAFLLVTLAMFIIIRMMNHAEDRLESAFTGPPGPSEPDNKKCTYCRTTIAYKATRCPNCTSQLETAAESGS